MVEKVVDELRDSQGSLEPVDGRGAQKGDYAIVAFLGTPRRPPVLRAARRTGCP